MLNIQNDGVVHHPLGGASYVFQKNQIPYLENQISKNDLRVSIGAQPNSSPHFGTMVVFSLAYCIASQMSRKSSEVLFEVVDTAPAETLEIGGLKYQRSLRDTHVLQNNIPEYNILINRLEGLTGVHSKIRFQREFNSQKGISEIVENIVRNRKRLASLINPDNDDLKIRAACPDCGLTDKNGINNSYTDTSLISYCPNHGTFETPFTSSSFEYSTPLRNLIRAAIYGKNNTDPKIPYEWLRVTGSDYAGFYQEQVLYRAAALLDIDLKSLPIILYAPLITDWSGAKLSKSLYVKKGAYSDIPKYLVDFRSLLDNFGEEGIDRVYKEVESWVDEPHKLFRNYSVYYFLEKVFQ